MGVEPVLIQVPNDQRIEKVNPELHAHGNVFCAEDVCRKDILILSQRVVNLVGAIEETAGEAPTKSCLYESANASLRRGRHGSFRVLKMQPGEVPAWLDAARRQYRRVYIAANNPHCWKIQPVAV